MSNVVHLKRDTVSRFVEINRCPLCDKRRGASVFYEAPFDSPAVASFVASYYGGRVPVPVLCGETFQIRHCAPCDFYWHSRVLNEQTMAMFYDDWIDPEASRAKQLSKGLGHRMHQCTLVARWLAATRARSAAPRVLDVGGGWGTLASCARALGCEAWLLESSWARRRYAEAIGLKTATTLSALGSQSFELAVMNQALEHIPNPMQLLCEVRRVLVPGGGLAVNVPRAHANHPVLAKGPFQPLEHINGFTARSLRLALVRAGFDVAPDPTRYVEFSVRGVLGAALRNLRLRISPSRPVPSEAGLAYFAIRGKAG